MFVSCTHVLSFGFVMGSDTRALCSVSCEIAVSSVDARSSGFYRLRAFMLCLVLCGTQLVFFIGCVLLCYHVLCKHVAYEYSH